MSISIKGWKNPSKRAHGRLRVLNPLFIRREFPLQIIPPPQPWFLGSISFLPVCLCLFACVFSSALSKSHGYLITLLLKAFHCVWAAFKPSHLGTSLEKELRLLQNLVWKWFNSCDKSEIFPSFASMGRGKWNHDQLSMKFNFPKGWLHLAARLAGNMQWEMLRHHKYSL